MRVEKLACCSILVLALVLAPAAIAQDSAEKAQEPEKPAEKAETAKTSEGDKSADDDESIPAVITTEWLNKRYGREVSPDTGPAATAKPSSTETPGSAEQKPAGSGEPSEEGDEETMSPEERAARIAEIEAELQRLDKRILGLKNPLLRGTYPAQAEERQEEQGKSAPERIRMVEERKAELQKELDELRAQ